MYIIYRNQCKYKKFNTLLIVKKKTVLTLRGKVTEKIL